MKKILRVFVFSICGYIAHASMVGDTNITVCRYQLPLRIERRIITVDKKSIEQCEIYLDKIENVYNSKNKKINIKSTFSYKTPDCNIETKFDSFSLVNQTKTIDIDREISLGITITKIDKKYCDQFPPNSLIINRPGR